MTPFPHQISFFCEGFGASYKLADMALFALQLKFTDLERRMEVRPAHREYLYALKEAGKLITAGPFADQTGALLIYDVADEAELRDILAKDPYTDGRRLRDHHARRVADRLPLELTLSPARILRAGLKAVG